MSEHLTRFFKSAHRLRRSERGIARATAVMELEDLRRETAQHPKLQRRIAELLNVHYAQKAKKTATT